MSLELRTLVIEDEPLARESLLQLVDEVPWLRSVGAAKDGPEAVAEIDRLRPDLVFLDVRLPELSGLEVLDRVAHRPAVVFTTAYDRYAVAAFEVEAVDYLVKPFGRGRFLAAVERVRRRIEASPLLDLASDTDRAREGLRQTPLARLFARKGGRIVNIPIREVVNIAACGDYAEVHTAAQGAFLIEVSLAELEQRLDASRFWRIHRSHIVNIDHVMAMEPVDDRRLTLTLRGGRRVVASRSGSRRLRALVR